MDFFKAPTRRPPGSILMNRGQPQSPSRSAPGSAQGSPPISPRVVPLPPIRESNQSVPMVPGHSRQSSLPGPVYNQGPPSNQQLPHSKY